MASPPPAADHGAHAHDAAHDDHGHDFDPEPATQLGPDEPRTPTWMPILGVSLLVVGATYYLSTRTSEASPGAAPTATATVVAAAPPPPPVPVPRPGAAGSAATLPNRANAEQIRKAMEEFRRQNPSATAVAAPPGTAAPLKSAAPRATTAPRPPAPPPPPPAPPAPGGAP